MKAQNSDSKELIKILTCLKL